MNTSLPQLTIQPFYNPLDAYSDQREHGYQGPSRHVRLARVTHSGGGLIAKSEDGLRCAVAGKESLRILRVSDPSQTSTHTSHKSSIGQGGQRIDASRNFWDTSGLKIDSHTADIAWGHGPFSNKVLTCARNGELIMWDVNRSGFCKIERRTKDHLRSINKMSVSNEIQHYCITGSIDGIMRVWDLRDMTKSIMRIAHPSSVRSLVYSPIAYQPLQAAVGLENGNIHRWDLKMGQRGQLDKLNVAHNGAIMSLDWRSNGSLDPSQGTGSFGALGPLEVPGKSDGWLVSGGLDRCVKVWDLSTAKHGHSDVLPTYTLHTSFPIRRVIWRTGYDCEVAIVSNNDYSTHTLDGTATTVMGAAHKMPGGVTRVSSGLGLDATVNAGGNESSKDRIGMDGKPLSSSALLSASGDAVEIWDVRRPWIAKWRVTGSASEGGATDIAFGDSHLLWTQHASGTFSQLDLRNMTKPIDSIPRTAVTWDVSGSVAFVVDKAERWEVPYDDVRPLSRSVGDAVRKPPLKALGDPPARITTQAVVASAPEFDRSDLEMFKILARKYIFEGRERQDICAYNAGVAFSAGHESAAQVWLLLGVALAQYVPPPKPSLQPVKAKKIPSPLLPSRPSPHQMLSNNGTSFPTASSLGISPDANSTNVQNSPAPRSGSVSAARISSYGTSTSSLRLTPSSSTASSPRHLLGPLPPLTPRHASFLGRRDSIDSTALGLEGSGPTMRRPSLPLTPLQSSSPIERSSMRNVGEGVLDDSDSEESDCAGDGEDEEGDETAGVNSSDEEGATTAHVTSPGASAPRPFPTPSPLSRVGRQAWTDSDEEAIDDEGKESDADDSDEFEANTGDRFPLAEDDGYVPSQSPGTDSEEEEHSQPRRTRASSNVFGAPRARRWSSVHNKVRIRSSTIASYSAFPRPLTHYDSRSSIRTVTAGETPVKDGHAGKDDGDSVLQGRKAHPLVTELVLNHGSGTAKAQSGENGIGSEQTVQRQPSSPDRTLMSDRRIESIRAEDRRFRASTLAELKDALEEFTYEGDVQMCTMLALVAPVELSVSSSRLTHFLDSYIELLTRLRLYTCAAYLRKYADSEAIRKPTLLGTTIYTSCGRCHKPLLRPAGAVVGCSSKGGFSYCLACKQACMMCSICRLPVRSLLFQCSICNHGGHQECYRRYYFQHPMVDLPLSLPTDNRGRPSTRSSLPLDEDSSSVTSGQSMSDTTAQSDGMSSVSIQSSMTDAVIVPSPAQHRPRKLAGHPCAAGCGHYCWAANTSDDANPGLP